MPKYLKTTDGRYVGYQEEYGVCFLTRDKKDATGFLNDFNIEIDKEIASADTSVPIDQLILVEEQDN
jgi:hypothetical protein